MKRNELEFIIRKAFKEEFEEAKKKLVDECVRPLNVKDASQFLRCSKAHIYKLIHRKEIVYFKPCGKMIYFMRRDLMEWAFRNRVGRENEKNE